MLTGFKGRTVAEANLPLILIQIFVQEFRDFSELKKYLILLKGKGYTPRI